MLMENTNTVKIKTTTSVFELPQRLGILQYVEYEPPPKEWCTSEGCLYEGFLMAEGCKRGICVRYRVWVWSKDGRRWEARDRWKRRRNEEGGHLRQQVVDVLWELAERHNIEITHEFTIIIDGTPIGVPSCRSPRECYKEILSEFKKARETPRPPPPPDPVEEEYKMLIENYEWLRTWRKDVVIEHLNKEKKLFLETLESLANPEIPDIVPLFLSRFEPVISLGCGISVYKSIDDGNDDICVSFCIKDVYMPRIVTYCHKDGWRYLEGTLQPLKMGIMDGRLRDIYILRDKTLTPKKYVRII